MRLYSLQPASVRTQQGAAVMIMLLMLILGSAYFLLTELNKGDPKLPAAEAQAAELGVIREALIGYGLLNNRCLPCPSPNPTSGVAATPPCPSSGYLPWTDLGLGETDRWGHRYRYVVDTSFTNAGCETQPVNTPGNLDIQTRNASGGISPHISNQLAVVLSHGQNGFGARNADGSSVPNPPAAHSDEASNRTATNNFMQRPLTISSGTTGGPFDDQLISIPAFIN